MAGYTRQSIASIINGEDITAPPLTAEFNQLADAFNGTTGHSHDGSSGNAPKIDLTTSVTGYLPAIHGGIGGKNNFAATSNPTLTDDSVAGYAVGSMWENTTTGRVFICVGNTGGAAVWRELVQVISSNQITPETTATVDLGTPSVRFQDIYLSGGVAAAGNSSIGGTLTVTGAATLNGGLTTTTFSVSSVDIDGGTIDGAVIGGASAQAITGTTITASTGFTGDLTGNVTGNITGNVTGDITGNVTGDLTGNVTSAGTSSFNNVTIDGTLNMNAGTTATITNLTSPTNTNDAATKGYVDTSLANLIDSAPGTLDTLNELAAALGDDPNFSTTITNSIATKLPLAGGTMTGAIAMGTSKITGLGDPTAAQDAATKAYVDTQDALQVSKSGDTMSGNLAMGSNNITGLATPTANDHAATKGYTDSILSSATSAAASAAAAATSETNAASSASSASTSATNAASSASSASTSETNAATSASAASASASNASSSETNAATSETNASTSATNAATSETNAATSETNAATSETNAATSATNAASSANAAASSASSASTSASAASSAQTAAEAARDATLTAYDNFDDRYLGAKSSAPTVDNDGNALVAGALYFDSTAGAMKVYTGSAWVAAYVSGTDYLPFSGGTMTGDVGHGDNVKATFGASADLQIYHDGSNSYIQDAGTGNLFVQASNVLWLRDASGTAYFSGTSGNEVALYHTGSEKLSTTSSGINVTGRIDADDAIAVEGSSPRIQVQDTDGTNQFSFLQQQGADVFLRARNNTVDGRIVFAGYGGSSTTNRLDISSGGDVRFWDETGAATKLVWDTSDEALEFGDSVKATFGASSDLQIYHDGNNSYVSDQGQGVLYIQGSNNVQIESATGENMAVFLADNAVELYYDNSKKLETTSSGVKVYDRLNVDLVQSSSHGSSSELDFDDDVDPFGSGQQNFTTLRSIGGLNLVFDTNDNDSNGFFVGQNSADTSLADTHFNINGDGDAKFFSTNSGTAKLTWDASDDALRFSSGAFVELNGWTITESGGSLYFATGGTNKMKLDASGNLQVVGSVDANATIT
jgi:hypothetical protein